ncbi:fused MFS/spermidine synthase, partial [Myxococcota bacterium]|nr:fused MFS/spermidine synthase [Myxococcota bacterium]
ITFFEINPTVVTYARRYFTYLRDAKATVKVILGDARIQMERQLKESYRGHYDVIVIDAFSGDSIPMHLLTMEALDLYGKLLKPGGVLAFHTSNMHLDIHFLVHNMATRLNLPAYLLESKSDLPREIYGSTWVMVTTNRELPRIPNVAQLIKKWPASHHKTIWTDNYGSILQLLK